MAKPTQIKSYPNIETLSFLSSPQHLPQLNALKRLKNALKTSVENSDLPQADYEQILAVGETTAVETYAVDFLKGNHIHVARAALEEVLESMYTRTHRLAPELLKSVER